MTSIQDPESTGISVKSLEAAAFVSPKLIESIKKADEDNDGFISAEELVHIIQAEQQAVQSSRILRKIIIALAVLLFLNVAATAGLTYGIVYLTKDSSVDSDNVVVSKSTGEPVGSATAVYSGDLANLYQTTNPVDLAGLQHLIIPEGDSFRIFQVGSMELLPNERVTLNTTVPGGPSIVIDSSGIHEVVSGANTTGGAGRRLLEASDVQGVTNVHLVAKPKAMMATPRPTAKPTLAPIETTTASK